MLLKVKERGSTLVKCVRTCHTFWSTPFIGGLATPQRVRKDGSQRDGGLVYDLLRVQIGYEIMKMYTRLGA